MTEAEKERLVILAEECAEVIQAVSKVLRHGWESTYDNGVRNDDHLRMELDDVLALIWRLEQTDIDCTQANPADVWEHKKRWMYHQ